MITVTYEAECSTECPGVDPAPPPVPGTWAMCEIHHQWWQAIDDNPGTEGEGEPVYLWLATPVPPYAVLVAAGLVPGSGT